MQGFGNAPNQPGPDASHRQNQEDHAGNKDRAQCLLPGIAQGGDHGEGKKGVQAHARCHADRPVGHKGHDERAQSSSQAGGYKNGIAIHPCGRQDVWIHKNNVGHGQEGSDTCQDLGTDVGAMLSEFEETFKHGQPPCDY